MDSVLVCGRGRDGKPIRAEDLGQPVLRAIEEMRRVLRLTDTMCAYLAQQQPTVEQLRTAALL